MPNAKPFPLYTDGAAIYYTTDGVNFNTLSSGGGGTITTSSPLSGDGSVGTPATIAAGAIANSKLANMAAATIKGSVAGGAPADLTAAQAAGIVSNIDTSMTGVGTAASPLGVSGWWARAQVFLQSKIATTLQFVPYKPGLNAASSSFTEANIEGGGQTPTSTVAAAMLSTAKVWQNPGAKPFAVMQRAKFAGAPSSNICDLGLAGSSVNVVIISNSGHDAANWYLEIDGAGQTLVTLSAADTNWHDFAITFDGTTISAWIDGVLAGSTAVLTNLPATSCSPSMFQQSAGQVILSAATWGYVAV